MTQQNVKQIALALGRKGFLEIVTDTDDYRPELYTEEGMQWVDDSSFKTVILRHFPELAATGLGNVTNAFEPWDTDTWLDPNRHPLRAYAPELKQEPWRGDAHR